MGTNELNYLDNLIEEMREKEAKVKAISEEIDALKALVRDTMATSEISEITTPNHHITYSQCERTTVDKKKLQALYPDTFGKVVKISKYMMLRIN